MKKSIMITVVCLFSLMASAQTNNNNYVQQEEFEQIEPTYLDNTFSDKVWNSNWFLSVKGGMSAFVGRPVGHGDLFDRKKPLLNISFGKWFTPYIGSRIAYQGLKMVNANLVTGNVTNIHSDFLYNIASHFSNSYEKLPRWDVIPYVGLGVIHNSISKKKPFALSYGFIVRYRLAERLHIAAEVANTTTWQYFDGIYNTSKFGDHLLQASIGLDITIGKNGWNRVVDPKPYIVQNDIMRESISKMREENEKLDKLHKKDALALAEMRKILEIEGLLEKYNLAMSDSAEVKTHPRNNYSGLNSLRARLRNKEWNGDANNYKPLLNKNYNANEAEDSLELTPEEYFQVMKDGKVYIGTPIFFFFQIGTDNLTEKAQIINIKEIAGCIRKYGLHARIVGAADSQTGTAYGNEKLSAKRAQYISKLLRENGVPQDKIKTQYRGGINSYEPMTGNRNTCVMLYFD